MASIVEFMIRAIVKEDLLENSKFNRAHETSEREEERLLSLFNQASQIEFILQSKKKKKKRERGNEKMKRFHLHLRKRMRT